MFESEGEHAHESGMRVIADPHGQTVYSDAPNGVPVAILHHALIFNAKRRIDAAGE